MVSSAINMDLADLLDTVVRLRQDYATDPEYQRLRADLPADWPI